MSIDTMGKVLVTVRVENLEDLYRVGQGAIRTDESVTPSMVVSTSWNSIDGGRSPA
jgi:hypothetical protein